MLKIIGGLIVILAASSIGIMKANELDKACREMEYLAYVLRSIESDMKYTKSVFHQILNKVSCEVKAPYNSWLKNIGKDLYSKKEENLGSIWKYHTSLLNEKIHIPKEEKEKISQLGFQVGNCDLEKQIQYLERYCSHLDHAERIMRKDLESKKRIYYCFGIAGGVLITIVFI